MQKIRIAFVETNCKKNGPIKQTLNIIQHMDRELFEPALITVWPEEEGNSILEQYQKLDIQIFSCGLSKTESVFKGGRAVCRYLAEFQADIAQGVGIPPYRMTLGYPKAIHFVTLRNYCYEDYPDQYGKGIGTVMAFADMCLIRKRMKMGEPFITCSESLTKIYARKENLEIPYIRNGVDVSQYTKRNLQEREILRKRLELPMNKIVFVYSGGLIDRKNQKEAIEAFCRMKKKNRAILLLLGDGKEREALERAYGDREDVLFRGMVSNVREYLHASDVYLTSSKSEGLPNSVLEAMACGLPVVLSDIPQHMEVLKADDACGYSYPLGDADALSTYMDLILDQDMIQMGQRSYEAVMENFTAEGMSKRYQRLYSELMEKKRDMRL